MGIGGAGTSWEGAGREGPGWEEVCREVNHKRGFVDPITGAHTNMIEGTWFHTKRHVKRGHGRVRSQSKALSIAFYEYMWMKKFNNTCSDADCRRLFNK